MKKKGIIFGGIATVIIIVIIAILGITYYTTTRSLAVECKINNS